MASIDPQIDARDFDLGDVISITAGVLVSPRHIGGVYDILGFMTGDALMTHQLPRAADACRPELLRQHPELAAIETPDLPSKHELWMAWLDEMKLQYGMTLQVRPLASWAHKDPIEELCDMVGPEKVFVFPEASDV